MTARYGNILAAIALLTGSAPALAWESDYTQERCILKQPSLENSDDFLQFYAAKGGALDDGLVNLIVTDSSLNFAGMAPLTRLDDRYIGLEYGDTVFDQVVGPAYVSKQHAMLTLVEWQYVKPAAKAPKGSVTITHDGQTLSRYDFTGGEEAFAAFENCFKAL